LVKKIVVTIALVGVMLWLLFYSKDLKTVKNEAYTYSKAAINDLGKIPEANYDFGLKAWFESRPIQAKKYFRHAAAGNVLHIDAWLMLAQVEAATGNEEKAVQILKGSLFFF